jgi:hypothetical protein
MTTAQLFELSKTDDGSTYYEYVTKEIERRIGMMSPERPRAVRVEVEYLGRHRAGRHRGARRPLIVVPSINFGWHQPATA